MILDEDYDTELKIIENSIDAKILYEKLMKHPNSYYMFHPEQCKYKYTKTIYTELKQMVSKKIYKSDKKKDMTP